MPRDNRVRRRALAAALLPLVMTLVASGCPARLVDKMGRDCPGILVDPVVPESSLLYEKLLPLPSCGSPMPIGKPILTAEELACVRDWISAQTPTGGGS